MAHSLDAFRDIGLDGAALDALLREHESVRLPALERLWAYYRNPIVGAGRRVRLAQERGLPRRLTCGRGAMEDDRSERGREVVIENDIAWRVHALVDFMFGRPLGIASAAGEASRRTEIESLLDAVFEASGGVSLLQDAALLGAVYGHVDLLVRSDALFARAGGPASFAGALEAARRVRIEVIEPTRAVPLVNARDYRTLDAMVIRCAVERREGRRPGLAGLPGLRALLGATHRARECETLEIHSASRRQRYEDGALVEDAPNRLGVLPVVHIQNMSQPFSFEGLSEVEPLIPLQDELNTRLSDRASRVTMQSFRMYLARGIEGFAEAPIAPGQVWSTDNTDASVEAIGGDASAPSEERHVEELREAMDKASAVTPVAAGVLRARLGTLSSENALRITLLGALSKTARKHVTYGRGLRDLCALVLRALDVSGVYRTAPEERAVRVRWPDPIPRDERDRLETARLKLELGIDRDVVMAELGYSGAERASA